jgi:hypothetical protein
VGVRDTRRQARDYAKAGQAKPPAGQPRKIGRPRTGKRSNPDYQQVSAWVRRDTYQRVTHRLFTRENRREFSDLVEELLAAWLRK